MLASVDALSRSSAGFRRACNHIQTRNLDLTHGDDTFHGVQRGAVLQPKILTGKGWQAAGHMLRYCLSVVFMWEIVCGTSSGEEHDACPQPGNELSGFHQRLLGFPCEDLLRPLR